MYFQLFACGRRFDVDAFLASTGLRCDRIFRRGDKIGVGVRTCKQSGFNLHIADASKLDLDQQFEAAAEFLKSNRTAVSQLRRWPGLEQASLILSPEMPIVRSAVGSAPLTFPASLVRLCAELDLEMGFAVRYKWFDEDDWRSQTENEGKA